MISSKSIKTNGKAFLLALTFTVLGGCGAWQSIKGGTIETTRSIFYTKLKNLKLDLIARYGLNQNERGQSLSTVVRIYQLKSDRSFEAAAYRDLLNEDKTLLGSDLLESKQVTLRPGEAINVDEKFNKDAEYIGVVAFFSRTDDTQSWKLLIPKKALSNQKALPIELADNTLSLLTAQSKKEP